MLRPSRIEPVAIKASSGNSFQEQPIRASLGSARSGIDASINPGLF